MATSHRRSFVERTPTSLDNMTVPVRTYRLLDGAGSLLWEEPVAYRFVSWGSLYRALLSEFSRERYHPGVASVGFSQDGDGVDLRFASGSNCGTIFRARGWRPLDGPPTAVSRRRTRLRWLRCMARHDR